MVSRVSILDFFKVNFRLFWFLAVVLKSLNII